MKINRREREKMKYTSAEAAKLLRKLNDERQNLLSHETQVCEFVASLGEDPESVRPEYDYEITQAEINETEKKIIKVKHAINVVNSTHKVPDFDMTVDEMLVYIPFLSEKKNRYSGMMSVLPKQRDTQNIGRNSNIIDYRYANYDISAAKADYEKAAAELTRAQLALDRLNTTETFDIDI